MGTKRKSRQRVRLKPEGQASVHGTPEKPNGSTRLDPSRIGLQLPAWLQDASVVPASWQDPQPFDGEGHGDVEPQSGSLTEGLKTVCICKGIKKRVFWKAMDDGACTKEEVNRATGSGSGSCQGRRCAPRILQLLRQHAGRGK